MTSRVSRWTAVLAVSTALVAGCHAPAPSMGAPQAGALPKSLVEPQGLDWSNQQIASRAITARRPAAVTRQLLAFPGATAAWTGGIDLAAYGCAAGDTVPNAPAVAFPIYAGELVNKLFFLSAAGKLIRVDRLAPTQGAVTLDLGKPCSHTAVTLSPLCTHAYVLSDDGTLSVVDTVTMTVLKQVSVAGGVGIAPCLDHSASNWDDTHDVVYVPGNDGRVTRFVFDADGAGGVTLSETTPFAVATDAQPLSGTRRVAAPAIAVAGVLYLGDQAGRFHAYDTNNPASHATYMLGGPIDTAPALQLQDGSYSATDPYGNPVALGYGEPVYAFVTAGASCAMLDLHAATTTYSQPLRIDDNQTGKTFGYLQDYAFSTAGTTETLVAVDGGNLNTESPDRPLPGYAAIRSNDYLVPAETNTYELNNEAQGGPVLSYVRWSSGRTYPLGSLISQATLTLSAAFDQACRVPEVHTTSALTRDGSALWRSDALDNANRPTTGAAVGRFLSGGVNGEGNFVFKKYKPCQWDVSGAFSTPGASYALSLAQQAGGDAVLWPEGPVGGATGKKAKKAYQVEAVKFANNPLNADAGAPRANDDRPTLTLTIAATTLPTPTIETPPVIDPVGKHVYVFYTNALYELDFASPQAFSDTDPSGAKHTLFALAHYGRAANGGGATFNGKKSFVGNFTAPLLAMDASAAYVLSRYPAAGGATPASWNYALSKVALPLSASVDPLVAGSPTFQGIGREASHLMLMEPRNKLTRTANLYYGLGNGRIYQSEP